MSDIKALRVFGGIVKQDNGMICLNDLYRVATDELNATAKRDPRRWRTEAGAEFIEFLGKKLNVRSADIFHIQRGRYGGTYAHWQIALAYAKYLSPELHAHVNEIYARYSIADASLATDIAERQTDPEKAKWIAARANAKRSRLELTDTLKEHGVKKPYQYASCTNAIYKPILGGTAKEVKRSRGVPAKTSLRDGMSLLEIMATGLAEELAKNGIKEHNAHGYCQCKNECHDAGSRVASIL